MLWLLGILGGVVALVGLLVGGVVLREKLTVAAMGREIGTWEVSYDVKERRIGLKASFSDAELLPFLLFRLHDLFDYHRGLEADRRRLAQLVTSAARGAPDEAWALVFQPADSECYHFHNSPNATLFRFFQGSLFEHAVSQPRFLGGDAIAKQQGLVGECVALTTHLINDPVRGPSVAAAVTKLVEQELAVPHAPSGPRFWAMPNHALKMV
jgi:hypothetical protein